MRTKVKGQSAASEANHRRVASRSAGGLEQHRRVEPADAIELLESRFGQRLRGARVGVQRVWCLQAVGHMTWIDSKGVLDRWHTLARLTGTVLHGSCENC